jgi:concanavalin A-like lectin/glucanase superfamily protein
VRGSRFAVLWLCVALAACGEKFVANVGAGGAAGASSAGRGQGSGAGKAESGGNAGTDDGAADAGDAGSETGGASGAPGTGDGGVAGLLGNPEPMLPRLGMTLWLRADRGVQQKEGHVQTWQDQSGNQINATQTSVAMSPAYLPEGLNGRPTVEFDGQGQFLKFAAGFADFSKGVSVLIVAKPAKSDCASMLEFSNGSEVDDVAFAMWQNNWTYEVGTELIQTGKVDLQRFSLYAVTHRPTGVADLRINGSVLSTLNFPLPASLARANNFIGHTLYGAGCEYFAGQISEVILYSRTLSESELTLIETYLNASWRL